MHLPPHRLAALTLGVVPVLLLGGCAESDDPGTADAVASAPPLTDTTRSAEFTGRLVEVSVADGRVTPPPSRVEVDQGEQVRVVVTSDRADTLHLHGYDLEAAVAPGAPGVIEFTADQGGQFELETHESGLILLQLLVR